MYQDPNGQIGANVPAGILFQATVNSVATTNLCVITALSAAGLVHGKKAMWLPVLPRLWLVTCVSASRGWTGSPFTPIDYRKGVSGERSTSWGTDA